jgi:hypothetical protein
MPAPHLFTQTIVAVIWDFDKTLIPGYMQEPLFRRFDIDANTFWDEVNAMPEFYRRNGLELISKDTLYLNHILTYVRHDKLPGLNNAMLRDLGSEIEFYPGLPDFFDRLRRRVAEDDTFARHEISVEHYIVSTGLRQMILGSAIKPFIDGVWACEFVETVPLPGFRSGEQQSLLEKEETMLDIGYVIDNTTKTRAVFEINKGTNKLDQITVNSKLAPEDRRIPFQNMIYVADGPSDVPVFSILNQYGGKTFAVYKPGSRAEFLQVRSLLEQGRVQAYGEADYESGSATDMWITTSIEEIARRIVHDREETLGDRVGTPPAHIIDKPQSGARPAARVVENPQPTLDEGVVRQIRPAEESA